MARRFVRFHAWRIRRRTRRHERRDEKVIALSDKDKGYKPNVQGELDRANASVGMGEHVWARHAGEERQKH